MDLGKINGIQEAVLDTVKMMFNEYTKNLNYDQTAVYTIYDDSEKDKGRYMVGETSDTVFTACSPNQQYKKGDKVYVTIPQGDSTQTKFIVSAYLDPVGSLNLDYRAPHAAIAPAEELNEEFIKSGYTKTGGTDSPYAGLSKMPRVYYAPVSNSQPNFSRIENDFTRLYVGAEFNKQFGENDKPEYGIEICIVTSNTEVTEENTIINSGVEVLMTDSPEQLIVNLSENFQTHTFKFFTNRMIGNLYNQGKSWQEDLIDITKLKNIVGIYFYLYLDSDNNNTSISVSRLAWKIGKDQQEMPNSLLSLYSANDLGYEENIETTKKLYLRRAEIDKNTGSYYITSKILPSQFEGKIIYGQANSNDKYTSDFLGAGWDELVYPEDFSTTYNFNFTSARTIEEIKAVEIHKNETGEWETYANSNSLVFYNKAIEVEDRPVGTLYLKPIDGIYEHQSYGLDGKLENIKDYEKFRQIQVAKVEKPGENKLPIKICWYYPRANSMLQDLAYWNTNQGRWNLNDIYMQNLDGNLGDYEIKIQEKLGEEEYDVLIINNMGKNYQGGYAIDYYFNPLYNNNEIICRHYYTDTQFDEGRYTPKFAYKNPPQDDFDIILSFADNERPFIAYNPNGYKYADGVNETKTFYFLPTALTWSVYSPFYRDLNKEEKKLTGDQTIWTCTDGEKDKYKVELISHGIQDEASTGFDLTPDSNYNNFYLTLSDDSFNKDFGIVKGCILNFEFKITDLQTNSIYSKNKKLAVPIKRELITDAYVDLKEGIKNYYYIKDQQLGVLSKNQPAGLKCSSSFKYNTKGGVETYATSSLEAFGKFSSQTTWKLPTISLTSSYLPSGVVNAGYPNVRLANPNHLNGYVLERDQTADTTMPETPGEVLNAYLGRKEIGAVFDKYYWSYDYNLFAGAIPTYPGNAQIKFLENYKDSNGEKIKLFYYLGQPEETIAQTADRTNLYWSNSDSCFSFSVPKGISELNLLLEYAFEIDAWSIKRNDKGSSISYPTHWVPLEIPSNVEAPQSFYIFSNKLNKIIKLVKTETDKGTYIGNLFDGYSESDYKKSDKVKTVWFYQVEDDDGIDLVNDKLTLIPCVSGKDLKAKYNNSIIYILNRETLIFEKVADTSTLTNNTNYYYLEAADQVEEDFVWEISSSKGEVPPYAPSIQELSSGVKYLRPHSIYYPTDEVFYISVWGGAKNTNNQIDKTKVIWQQPIIIYGPNELPTNTQEGEAIGLAAVDSNGDAAGSISLGQQTSDLIQKLNDASEAKYGLITSDAQAPVFMLTEQGDVVMDLTHTSSGKIKQEIAIKPENLKIKDEDGQLKTLDEYIKAIIKGMQ